MSNRGRSDIGRVGWAPDYRSQSPKCNHNTIRVRRFPFGPVRWVCVRCQRWFKEKPDQ